MKKIVIGSLIVSMFVLLYINISIFVAGTTMTEEIVTFNEGIQNLKHENELLEQKLYAANSLNKSSSAAASLDFTAQVVPVYVDAVRVALR